MIKEAVGKFDLSLNTDKDAALQSRRKLNYLIAILRHKKGLYR